MKQLITITICLAVMLFAGSAFAGGSGGGNTQGQSTDVDQVQWQYNAGVGTSMGGNQSMTQNYPDPKIRVGMIQPGLPYHLHVGPAPSQTAYWNSFGGFEVLLSRTWKRREVDKVLNEPFCEWGFETESQFFGKYKKTHEIELKTQVDSQELAGYDFIGMVNVRAKKDKTSFEGLMRGLELSMEGGGNLALIDLRYSRINTIMNGVSVGPGASVGHAGSSSSAAASLGFNFSDTKAQGETAIILAVLKKNGSGVKLTGKEVEVPGETTTEPVVLPKEEAEEKSSMVEPEKTSEEAVIEVQTETQEVSMIDTKITTCL